MEEVRRLAKILLEPRGNTHHSAANNGKKPDCWLEWFYECCNANGAFHCLLVCPCGGGHGAKCDHASHKHCPGKSRCARGELRKMDLGVCTYDAVDA